MTSAQRYNYLAMERDDINPEHVEELVRFFQRAVGLPVDGMLGAKTRELLMDSVVQPSDSAVSNRLSDRQAEYIKSTLIKP